MADIDYLKKNIFPGESGGDYNALFGYSNRPGGQFGGMNLTDLTVDQALAFANPSGPYGQWVKGQVGRVATPMGAYQIVGTTLGAAKKGLGLTGNEKMTPELQDQLGLWIYQTQGPGAWEAWGKGGGGGGQVTTSTKGGAPMGLLDIPQDDQGGGIMSLLTGKQKPWATKLNDIGAVLLALSGSPAAQPLLQMVKDRKEGKREDARMNKTAQWLAANGRTDLAEAMMSGALSASDAAKMAMTPAEAPAPVELKTFTGPDGIVYSFNPVTGEQKPLTGAETPDPGFTVMTPEEVASLGLPPGPYQRGPKGEIKQIGGAGTTVNVDTGAGGKFEEAFAKGDAETIGTVYDAGLAAQRNLGRIDQLAAVLETSPTGLEGATKQMLGEMGIATEGLDALQSAQALINSLVPEQRQPGSGPMSDADLALFKQSLPRIINQPGGNKMIVDTMRAIAQYDAEGAAIVQRLRSGELSRAEAFAALQNRANPLEGLKGGGAAAAPAGDWTEVDGVKIRVKP